MYREKIKKLLQEYTLSEDVHRPEENTPYHEILKDYSHAGDVFKFTTKHPIKTRVKSTDKTFHGDVPVLKNMDRQDKPHHFELSPGTHHATVVEGIHSGVKHVYVKHAGQWHREEGGGPLRNHILKHGTEIGKTGWDHGI